MVLMVFRRGFLLLSSLALAAPVFAQPEWAGKVRDRAEEFRAEKGAVGLSVTISQRGRVVFSEGFGYQNEVGKVKATKDTIYRLASVSKPLSAIGLMKLEEQGKADLQADIRSYAPKWPDKGRITLWNILTHTSGIRHYVSGKNDNITKHYPTQTAALDMFSGDALAYPTGTKNQYSTHAWTLLGAAIEGIAHTSFADYMNTRIFGPMKVPTLRIEDLTQPAPANRSALYGRLAGKPFQHSQWLDNSWKAAGGGMESSSEDLAKFVMRFMDGEIVRPSTVTRMLTPQPSPASPTQGLGWGVNGDMFMHSGSQQGSSTFVCGFKGSKTVIVVLCNTEDSSPTTLALEIAQMIGVR